MAELVQFSPDQIKEAEDWYINNYPNLLEIVGGKDREYLYGTYFDLKVLSRELRPHQFVIGVDYESKGSYEADLATIERGEQLNFNLSFWNPHAKGMADRLAKEFLITKLSQLK